MDAEGEVKIDISSKTCAAVTWKDGHVSRWNVKWLRFHCHCERCFRPFSGMYPLDKPKFSDEFGFASASVEGGDLQFTIDQEAFEGHVARIPLEWIRSHCNCKQCIAGEILRREIRSDHPGSGEMNYGDIAEKEGMHQFLENVLKSGYCLLHGVPDEERMSLKIGEKIGPTFSAMFQESTQLLQKSLQESRKQHLHQDMPFYEVLPGVQVFYAKKQTGVVDTVLADLMEAAEIFRKESPGHFASLVRIPVTFEYKDNKRSHPVWYEIQKPHIELDYFGKIVAVHWNPALEGPLRVHAPDVIPYCKAHNAFADVLKRKENRITLKLKQRDVLILNNHRMAHSHVGLAGPNKVSVQSFLNIDDLKSTYIVLAQKLGREFVPMKVGNRSSF